VSPSVSASSSISPSVSHSASTSPSSSASPSASTSPSASLSPTDAPPTYGYDVYLYDQTGYDLLEGVGEDRDRSATEQVPIVYSGTSVNPVVDEEDTLTLTISGNAVASALINISLYYTPGV